MEYVYKYEQYFRRNLPVEVIKVVHNPENFPQAEDVAYRREFWKIVYIISGNGVFRINGRRYPFSPRFIYLSHPDDLTTLELTGDVQLYNIIFRKEAFSDDLQRLYGEYRFFSLFYHKFSPEKSLNHELLHIVNSNRSIYALIRKMEREYQLNDANSAEMLRYSLLELLVLLARQSAKHYNRKRKNEIIHFVDNYLQEHFRKKFDTAALADDIGISRGYLFTIYQKEKHCSIGEELLRIRLEALKHGLRSGGEPVESLCYRCGFSDLGNLYKVFRREVGMTPGEYRDQHSNPAI